MFRKLLMSLAFVTAIVSAPAQATALENSPDQNAVLAAVSAELARALENSSNQSLADIYVVDVWMNPDGYYYFVCNDNSYGYFWVDNYNGQIYDFHYFPRQYPA